MKPVELDFLINNGTQATLEKIARDTLAVGENAEKGADVTSAAMQRAAFQALLLSDSIQSVEAQLMQLRTTDTTIDQSENIKQITQLENVLEGLKVQYTELQKQASKTNPTPESIPAATRQFNGLHMSIQQLAREMPTLALGPEVFMLAISNNLPIFTDEVARASREYDDLLAQGKKGTPVWQQMLKSIFSPQTALTAMTLLFVMYGKEIFGAVGEMLNFNDASEDTKERLSAIREEMKNTVKSAADITVNITSLSKKWRELGDDVEAQKKFLIDNREELDKTGLAIKSVEDAEQALVDKLPQYLQYLNLKAQADAAYSLAVKDNTERIVKMRELQDKITEIDESEELAKSEGRPFFSQTNYEGEIVDIRKTLRDELETLTEEQSPYQAIFEKYSADAAALLSGTGLVLKETSEAEAEIVIGSIAELEKQIADKRKQLATTTNSFDYKVAMSEIEDMQKRLNNMTGKTANDEYTTTQKKYSERVDESNSTYASEVEADVNAEHEAMLKGIENREKLLEAYATFEQRRNTLTEQYQKDRAAMFQDEEQTIFAVGFDEGNLAKLKANFEAAIKGLNDEAFDALQDGTNIIAQIFDDTAKRTTKQINTLREQTEELMAYLANTNDADITAGFGMSAEQLKTLKASPDQLKAISDALDELYEKGTKQNPFAQLATDAKRLFSKDGMTTKNAQAFNTSFNGVLSSVTNVTSSLREMYAATGNDEAVRDIENLEEAFSSVANVAQAFAQGGWIAAAVAAVSEVIGSAAKQRAYEAEIAEMLEDRQREAYFGELEVNQLYRERYEWAKQIGETNQQNAEDNLKEARAQLEQVDKEAAELWGILGGQQFISGGHWDWNWLGTKADWVDEYANLAGLTENQVDLLYRQGKLTGDAVGYYETYLKLKEEGADLTKKELEYQQQLNESTTGMTYDEVVSKATDNLMDGSISAAESYDEIMQGAATNMLEQLMNPDIKEWYEGFAQAGLDGYTEAEKKMWGNLWEEMQAENEKRKQEIEKVTGVDLSQSSSISQSAQAGAFTTMSQDQGTKLEGLFTANEIHNDNIDTNLETAIEQLDRAASTLDRIKENTEFCRHLETIMSDIKDIKRDGLKAI